jgi:hypothetical protein
MISPLSLDQLTRDTWGQFDAAAIAQIADLAGDSCYAPKFYKAPDVGSEVFQPYDYLAYGLKLTPGSLITGIYLPANPATLQPAAFNVQVTDSALGRKWFDAAIPSFFLGNYKAAAFDTLLARMGSFPGLLNSPYPVVGDGLFLVELWESSGAVQRIELVFGVLEAVGTEVQR